MFSSRKRDKINKYWCSSVVLPCYVLSCSGWLMETDHAMNKWNLQKDFTNAELYKTFQHYKNVKYFIAVHIYSLSSTFFSCYDYLAEKGWRYLAEESTTPLRFKSCFWFCCEIFLWLGTHSRSLFFHFSDDNNNTTYLFSNITGRIYNFPEIVLCHWLKNCIKRR